MESPYLTSYYSEKLKVIPPNTQNKARLPPVTTSIHHTTGSPSQRSKAEKRNKNFQTRKEEVKFFANGMILQIENSKDSIRKIVRTNK